MSHKQQIEIITSNVQKFEEQDSTLKLVVRFITPKVLDPEMIKAHHKTLENAEIRWRHLVPEENADAILGMWEKSWVDESCIMYAEGTIWGDTDVQLKAQELVKKWRAENEQFGVSAGFLRIRDSTGKTKRVLFREGSLTPFAHDPDAQIIHAFQEQNPASQSAQMLTFQDGSNLTMSGNPPGAPTQGPFNININIGTPKSPEDQAKIDEAKRKLQEGLQLLNEAAGGAPLIPEDSEDTEETDDQISPIPNADEENEDDTSHDSDSLDSDDDGVSDKDELDVVKRKEKLRKRKLIQSFEGSNMPNDEKQKGKMYESKILELEASNKALQAQMEKSHNKLVENEVFSEELEKKLKEAQTALNTKTASAEQFEDTKKQLDEATTELNELKGKLYQMKLQPKRLTAAKLVGCQNKEQAVEYIKTIHHLDDKALDSTIASLELLLKQNKAVSPNSSIKALEGEQPSQVLANQGGKLANLDNLELSVKTDPKDLDAIIEMAFGK